VPGEVPLESIQASVYEEKILLKWREPAQTFGIITQYEVNTHIISSFRSRNSNNKYSFVAL